MRSKAYSTSLEVIARLTGGPNLRPDLSLKVYVKPSLEIVGSAVARSGCSSLPFGPAVWLVATSVRSSASYIENALARYSPVGSKALVNPKSSCAVRNTPPFWTPPVVPPPPPPPPPPPQAAAIRAIARASPTMPIQRRLLPIIPRLSTEGIVTVVGVAAIGFCNLPSRSRDRQLRSLGPRASRSPSPTRLNERVVSTRNAPGKTIIHHA